MAAEPTQIISITCRGLWNRGTLRSIPRDRASVLDDFRFTDVPVVREPIELELNCQPFLNFSSTGIRRSFAYKRTGENVRYIILDDTGRFYDSGLASPGDPILGPLTEAVDFSAIQLYNRVYFTIHDRNKGVPGGFLYVYDPDLGVLARPAAGYEPFTPSEMAPSAWHSADSIKNLKNGDKVTLWPDLTGKGNHLGLASATEQPIWIANAANSLPAIQSNSSTHLYGTQLGTKIHGANGVGTIFAVYKASTGTGGFSIYAEPGIRGLAGDATVLAGSAYDGAPDTVSKAHTLDVWHIGMWMYDGTNVHVAMDDQDTAALVSGASGTQQSFDPRTFDLSALTGYVAEIIAFPIALTEAQRRRVTYWLKQKYKLTDTTTDPVGLTLAEDALAGNTEPGQHIFAVSYITNTGHVTPPGAHAVITAGATKKTINVTNIPIGPAHVVKKWIWMSKVLRNWDGNLNNPELFFVKEIADNTTTGLSGASGISAYDSQLVSSADPYLAQLSRIPASVGLCDYDGSLVTVGEYDNPALARVSNQGSPETFNSIDGFIQTAPGDGGGLKNAESLGGALYLFKSYRTLGTQRNDLAPSSWPLNLLDIGRGAECFSVATVLDSLSATLQYGLIVCNPTGIWLFNGSYLEPLHYAFEQSWIDEVVSTGDFAQTTACVDPITKRIFVHVGGRATFMISYAEGIDKESVRHSKWSLGPVGQNVNLACIFRGSGLMPSLVYTKFGGSDGLKQIRRVTLDGMFRAKELYEDIPIPWRYVSAPIPPSDKHITGHISGFSIYGILGDGYSHPGRAMVLFTDAGTGAVVIDMPRIPQFGGRDNAMVNFYNADFTFQHLLFELSQDMFVPSALQLEKINLFVAPDAEMVPL